MRQTQIFSGSSHPALVDRICDRLGQQAGQAELRKFSNGETSVQIQTSIRNQDVFICQSGSSKINDNVMELLIMISACKSGSARSITAVMPYFPYSRQSKKKSHRGAITARMIANLLNVAGVDHVITIDLHASQMQGFFKCPVDNLVAEPLIARWLKHHVPNWQDAVVVSKNPGGTKRVTSLADAMKLSFGIVTTERRRQNTYSAEYSVTGSVLYETLAANGGRRTSEDEDHEDLMARRASQTTPTDTREEKVNGSTASSTNGEPQSRRSHAISNSLRRSYTSEQYPSSPLARSARPGNSPREPSPTSLARISTAPEAPLSHADEIADEFTDERARDVIHGRLVHGHIVDEDFPSPAFSARSSHTSRGQNGHQPRPDSAEEDAPEHMMSSFMSTASSFRLNDSKILEGHGDGLGGTGDAGASSDEEEENLQNPEVESTVTLVGNVKDRPVFIVDDMIDKAGSWIAAAETVVKRGGATKVYCIATHGLFGGDSLKDLQECECIEQIIVTNSFPLEEQTNQHKLVVLDVSPLLAEAIRRNHNGESISQLFMHYD
ncbi:hypothetical protein BLS_003127 [Venturia inaequalis]|uniref:Ribose-phosphate pyrophosphokinase 1 n=1 Tax=Venturia inaequalis TaxID=5025 RepID=A0A8H3YYK8_VENIN|nr:hypothetical protein BLS_003127 [Venturia inaequalis]KAE9984003.1 hypothetical protein EG328_009260 [Venturia inaequalis]RDI86262.1 hypothetical protein Vi05172_g3721 [Venturia inaequalis]